MDGTTGHAGTTALSCPHLAGGDALQCSIVVGREAADFVQTAQVDLDASLLGLWPSPKAAWSRRRQYG